MNKLTPKEKMFNLELKRRIKLIENKYGKDEITGSWSGIYEALRYTYCSLCKKAKRLNEEDLCIDCALLKRSFLTKKGCGKRVSGEYEGGGYWEMNCGDLGRLCEECRKGKQKGTEK